MDTDESVTDANIGLLIKSVVHKRKTFPKRILEYKQIKATNEINNLLEAKVDLQNDIAKMEIKLLCEETEKLISRHSYSKSSCNYGRLRESQRNLNEIEQFLQLIHQGEEMEE